MNTFGGDARIIEQEGTPALITAMGDKIRGTFEFFLRYTNSNIRCKSGAFKNKFTPYSLALYNQCIKMCKTLLCHGATPEINYDYISKYTTSKKMIKNFHKTVFNHQMLILLYCLENYGLHLSFV
jgi:hypothetical protein